MYFWVIFPDKKREGSWWSNRTHPRPWKIKPVSGRVGLKLFLGVCGGQRERKMSPVNLVPTFAVFKLWVWVLLTPTSHDKPGPTSCRGFSEPGPGCHQQSRPSICSSARDSSAQLGTFSPSACKCHLCVLLGIWTVSHRVWPHFLQSKVLVKSQSWETFYFRGRAGVMERSRTEAPGYASATPTA